MKWKLIFIFQLIQNIIIKSLANDVIVLVVMVVIYSKFSCFISK